jgi:hypothetical protein
MGRLLLVSMIRDVARTVAHDLGALAQQPMAYIGTAAETVSDQDWPKVNRAALVEAGFNRTITRSPVRPPQICGVIGQISRSSVSRAVIRSTCWSKCRK